MAKHSTTELLPVQYEIKTVADEVLNNKPKKSFTTYWDIKSAVDPVEIETFLKAQKFGSILLAEGEPFGIEGSDYYEQIPLRHGDVLPGAVYGRAWGWDWDKTWYDESRDKVIRQRGKKDWARQLDIILCYENESGYAQQTLTTYTSSSNASIPTISRSLAVPDYTETGYEGHGHAEYDDVTVEDMDIFISAFKRVISQRSQ